MQRMVNDDHGSGYSSRLLQSGEPPSALGLLLRVRRRIRRGTVELKQQFYATLVERLNAQ